MLDCKTGPELDTRTNALLRGLHGENLDSNVPARYPLKRGAGSCRLSRLMTVNQRRWSAGLNGGLPLIPRKFRSALYCAHGMRFAATHTLCTITEGQRPCFLRSGVLELFMHGQAEFALGSLECMHTPAAPMLCSGAQVQHQTVLTMYAEADLCISTH